MKLVLRASTMVLVLFLRSPRLFAGFPSSEQFLPAVGDLTLAGGTRALTTVWVTNLSGAPVSFTFSFLKQGQANANSANFTDSLGVGETKVYENVVETKLGLANVLGGARVVSTGEILVAERIFNQAPGTDLGATQGLFFAGVPKGFSISAGQSASIQGLNQGGAENFRYNFALVETGGGSPTVNVQVFDGSGALLGQKAFSLSPFEQLQPNVAEVVPGFSSINARITATVTGGTGSVLLAGAQVANESLDSSGFEMSFRDDLLGGGTAGVTSLNGLTGALTLTAGNGISVTPSGHSIAIAFTGGGSSGITSVTHDATLAGNGTGAAPLGVAVPLALGSIDGSALTVGMTANTGAPAAVALSVTGSTTGKATALSIDVAGTLTNNDATAIHASVHGDVRGIVVSSENSPALVGDSFAGSGSGVVGDAGSGIGVIGTTHTGDAGVIGVGGSGSGLDAGVFAGVIGDSNANNGVVGLTGSSSAGVLGMNKSAGVDSAGVMGIDGTGTSGQSGSLSAGVLGESNTHIGVEGRTATGVAAVRGLNSSSSNDVSGVFGRDGTGTAGISGLSAGVRGESATNIGVLGLSQNFGVIGRLKSGVQGELASHRTQDWGLFTNNDIHGANGVFTGTLTATNLKSFVEPHPTDPTKQIRFVCLEGPESGTYFRGSGHIVGGFAKIEVPESFRAVTDDRGLTVVATAVGGPGAIWVMKKGLSEIVLQANTDVEFDYVVNGVRKAYHDFTAIENNQNFLPDGPDDRRFALYAPEIQRRLVSTGIYHPDGTVDLETAKRLGWDKSWSKPEVQ